MAHLVDTSVLGRLANKKDIYHDLTAQAIVELHRQGKILYITSGLSG